MSKLIEAERERDTAPQPPSECGWIVDTEGTYATDCGHFFQFNDGTPAENEAAFCLYCGKTLHYVAFEEETEEQNEEGAA